MTPCAKKPVKLQFPCSYSNVHDPQPLWLMQIHFHLHIHSMVWVIEVTVMGSITGPCHPKGQFAGVPLVSTLIPRLMNSVHPSALSFHSSSSKLPLTSGLFSHFSPPYFFSLVVWVFFQMHFCCPCTHRCSAAPTELFWLSWGLMAPCSGAVWLLGRL